MLDQKWIAILSKNQKAIRGEIHNALKKANFDYSRNQFNTVVSACMKVFNALPPIVMKQPAQPEDDSGIANAPVVVEGIGILIRLLAPIAPHLSHHLWQTLGFGESISDAIWPEPDESALVQDSIQYVVQVNGKLRAKIELAAETEKSQIEEAALADENVNRFIEGQTVRKIIVVPNKLVNIVVS